MASRKWAIGISVAGTSSLAACQRQWTSCRPSKKHNLTLLASMGASTAPNSQRWQSLAMPRRELCLAFTLPTGQSFRWRKTDNDMYTGVIHQRVVRCFAPYPPLLTYTDYLIPEHGQSSLTQVMVLSMFAPGLIVLKDVSRAPISQFGHS